MEVIVGEFRYSADGTYRLMIETPNATPGDPGLWAHVSIAADIVEKAVAEARERQALAAIERKQEERNGG